MLCLMNTDERTALGARVEQARTAARMGKEAAARKAGISAITWKRVEDGLRVQDVKLAAVLDALEPDTQPPVVPAGARTASDDELLAELTYRMKRYAADNTRAGEHGDDAAKPTTAKGRGQTGRIEPPRAASRPPIDDQTETDQPG